MPSTPEHLHLWCIRLRGPVDRLEAAKAFGRAPRIEVVFRSAWCRCGLTCASLGALAYLDRPAFEQLIDPQGFQREFMQATGLDSAAGEPPCL